VFIGKKLTLDQRLADCFLDTEARVLLHLLEGTTFSEDESDGGSRFLGCTSSWCKRNLST